MITFRKFESETNCHKVKPDFNHKSHKMQNSINRRRFLKLTAAGAAGGFIAGSGAVNAASLKDVTTLKKGEVMHRTLGRTGLKVPLVNLGFVRSDNPRIINYGLDLGMTLIDTAHGYSNGRNEEVLGELLKNRPRDSYILATRVRGNTEEQILEQFNISLERLQLDYVDILGLHGSSSREHTLDEARLKAFTKIKAQGRARFLSVSTHSNEPEVIRAVAESNVYDLVYTSYNFRMDNFPDLKKAIDEAAEAGIGIIAMKTMAGAYWDRERQDPINLTAALKWALQNPNIHSTIPGVESFNELEENFEANYNIDLSPGELNDLRLDQADRGMFCLGCEKCIDQCPKKLPVPDIMRSYMYAYGYKSPALARETMDSLSLGDDACKDCSSCSVKCLQGFDVAEKIKDINRIKAVPNEFLA